MIDGWPTVFRYCFWWSVWLSTQAKQMHTSHFLSDSWVAVNPNDIFFIWTLSLDLHSPFFNTESIFFAHHFIAMV